jgi:ribosomal protein S18 acetylase RimI-like enzyme
MGLATEWREYVEGLTRRPGCGTFVPEASLLAREGASLAAVALATQIGPETAHLAQLAVAPQMRRGGTARALVQAVGAAVQSTRGCRTLTLLVSAANTPAARLYRGLGFRPSGGFLAARRTPSAAFVHQDCA